MMKIINKIRSMLIVRRTKKEDIIRKKVREFLDKYIEESCKLTFYIKPGYQEPTYFVVTSTIDGKEHIVSIWDFGIISASEIVEAVEMIQASTWKCQISFAVTEISIKTFLQDKGFDNVISPTKEEYERILLAIASKDLKVTG